MTPLIQAKLGRKDFAVGESVQFTLSVTNPSATELLAVADPRRGGDSLRFNVGFPNGQELSFTTGEALQAPGVKQIPIDMRVPPNVRQDFEFEILAHVRRHSHIYGNLFHSWRLQRFASRERKLLAIRKAHIKP